MQEYKFVTRVFTSPEDVILLHVLNIGGVHPPLLSKLTVVTLHIEVM